MSIFGSFTGNLLGTIYFLYFQIIGLTFMVFFLYKKSWPTILLTGSVLGSVLMQWVPALISLFMGFTTKSHIIAAIIINIPIIVLMMIHHPYKAFHLSSFNNLLLLFKKHFLFIIFFSVIFLTFSIMLSTHTLYFKADGLHTGQCSYGDMQMHLGFITSIAKQKTFPPYYSIAPGNKLCYPFLCDSISSSIYIFGASLRYAYMLPMFFAFAQVIIGFYMFSLSWLKNIQKSILSCFLFFLNGGLGFIYFFDWSKENTYTLSSIFTDYYHTPTNLIDRNIRWVNIIVDMLLPQRATLFGYAVLFTCMYLLYKAAFNNEKELFPLVGLLTASLPMIHTHSFLAIGLISATWLLMILAHNCKNYCKSIITIFLIFMSLVQIFVKKDFINQNGLLFICFFSIVILFLVMVYFLINYIKNEYDFSALYSWGFYLLINVILALPQLLAWTFKQASNSGFNSGHFNWGNQGDPYIWFYVKNWGIIFFIIILAIFYCSKKNFDIISAALVIWYIIEFISFSPNTYDNNKLLYVAYAMFCCLVSDFLINMLAKLKKTKIQGFQLTFICFLIISSISGILSIGRELVSDYLVYSLPQIEVADFVEKNCKVNDTFLTNDRHVNEIAALTGRNIVSGSGIYLGPHGIYDENRVADVIHMYNHPLDSDALFKKYKVNYIVISSWERANYQIDESQFKNNYKEVFSSGDIQIFEYPQ